MENNKIKNLMEMIQNPIQYSEGYVRESLDDIEKIFCELKKEKQVFLSKCKSIEECITDLKAKTNTNEELMEHINTAYKRMCEKYNINPRCEIIKNSCNCDLIP